MLVSGRHGNALDALEGALDRIDAVFTDAGHERLAPPYLFEAETLLDLYGEDLRTRAFLYAEPGQPTEVCLRPDFTVPTALIHGTRGWERTAAYSYRGPVFRRQITGPDRPVEYLQAGIERFGDSDSEAADAKVLALILAALGALGVTAPRTTIGDPGIVFALLDTLEMPARRRAALRHHFWRPGRFQGLIDAAVRGETSQSPNRQALLHAAHDPRHLTEMADAAGEWVGRREPRELVARAKALAEAAYDPPMPEAQALLIADVLGTTGTAGDALVRLRDRTASEACNITPALDRFERRLSEIDAHGIDAESLPFDAAFGRNLEYYDGFVFEVRAQDGEAHPPLAGGGRYDAMTTRLGATKPVPAIGAMIRPEAVLALGTAS